MIGVEPRLGAVHRLFSLWVWKLWKAMLTMIRCGHCTGKDIALQLTPGEIVTDVEHLGADKELRLNCPGLLERERDMRKIVFGMLICLWLSTAVAWGQDALDYYHRGLKSSVISTRIDYFNKALQLNPNLAEAYEKRAIHYYFQRHYDRAIEDYTRVIDLWPHRSEAHRMRGMSFLRKGELDRAISDFSRVIELDPQLASAHGYRAEAYRLKGMTEEAMRDANVAIELKGDLRTVANAHATRAKLYQELGRQDLADSDFKKSFELDPRYVILRYFYGTFRLEDVSRMGLVGIVGLLFVGIFKLGLTIPRKKDQD